MRDLYVQRRDLALPLAELTLKVVDSALSQRMLESLKSDPLSFVNTQIDPKGYLDAEDFRKDYLCVEMLSKYKYLDLQIDREKVALTKFLASEDQCRLTNKRLSSSRTLNWKTTSIFEMARRKIECLLGPFDWNEAERYFGFGPGGTTRLRKSEADWYYKFSGIPECTPNCEPLARTALKYFSMWGDSIEHKLSIVQGNAVITVPKNAKTDRVIAKEPCMNMFIQKGIGGVIRRRLKRVGVDLNDQTYNQHLAFIGSVDGSLATIDLSAASDSVSLEIVRLLLPPDWCEAITLARSERGVLPSGEMLLYQKVSSMGNGFTFELESLIFWALARATTDYLKEKDRRLAVYGDDIIVPVSCCQDVVEVLSVAGFTVNEKKTHTDGPFRESCGKHYFKGVDVTPIYVKDRVDTYPSYIWICNQLKRWSYNRIYGCDPLLKPVYDLVRGSIKGYWSKARIPDGFGDGALIGDFDEVLPKKAPSGHFGYVAHFFTEQRGEWVPSDQPIILKSLWILRLKGIQDVGEGSSESFSAVPTRRRQFRKQKTPVWQWRDLGPWLA